MSRGNAVQINWIVDDCIALAARFPGDLYPSTVDKTLPSNEKVSKSISPVQETMEMLPVERQNELLKISLSHTLQELGRFKRVPSPVLPSRTNETPVFQVPLGGFNSSYSFRPQPFTSFSTGNSPTA